jgi:membrane fusion protein (multidrug efflux system)
MPRASSSLIAGLLFCAAVFGCGRPPAGQAVGGDFQVRAVVALVEERPIEEKIFLVGNLAPTELVDLRSELDAKVIGLGFEEGDQVQTGQVLVRLDDSKLQAELEEAQARYNLARLDFERGESLLESRTISKQQFDQFDASFEAAAAQLQLVRERLRDSVIKAPFDGQMTERRVSPGQYVDTGELLSTLVQITPLKVEFNVPERYLGQIDLDQQIDISTVAYPGQRFGGRVYFISPRLDEDTRTVLVKAYIDNEERLLKPGMFANLDLIFRASGDALVIPETAISYRGDEATVVVVNEEDRAEFRSVSVGLRLSGLAEITDGLSVGERVVVEGSQKLSPGTAVIVSPRSERYGVTVPASAQKPG